MRYRVLAFDYDGTLATDGHVPPATADVLDRAVRSGRRLLLVTGRHLDDLRRVVPRLDLFALVVAENGGLLHDPATGSTTPLAPAPAPDLVARLRAAGVSPLGVGAVVVDTRVPHDAAVRDAVRDLGLRVEVSLNKGAVMVLPAGVTKGTGLAQALRLLGEPADAVVGVGDAENDLPFLAGCGLAVAVANALPAVKERCDVVTAGSRGDGVVEIVDRILATDG